MVRLWRMLSHVYAKFGDDPLLNEEALAAHKSDNNKNNVGGT